MDDSPLMMRMAGIFLTKGFVAARRNYSDKVSKNVVWLTYNTHLEA